MLSSGPHGCIVGTLVTIFTYTLSLLYVVLHKVKICNRSPQRRWLYLCSGADLSIHCTYHNVIHFFRYTIWFLHPCTYDILISTTQNDVEHLDYTQQDTIPSIELNQKFLVNISLCIGMKFLSQPFSLLCEALDQLKYVVI